MKIQSFTDLEVWKQAHKLVIEIYRVTKKFPKEERYSLVDQMRRAAISITSNIAEGFSRQGKKEKLQFYFMARFIDRASKSAFGCKRYRILDHRRI